jgi:hypothetical protein
MLLIEKRAVDDFDYFINNVFALSFDEFISGQYVSDVADHMNKNPFAMYITGRGHFKSTRVYARLMWHLLRFKHARKSKEGWYFSYNQDMSAYHLGKVRELIAVNPFYNDLTNYKAQTDSVLGFAMLTGTQTLDRAPKFIVKPAGLLVFKRGIHADFILVDDPLKDPENKLKPTVIIKVNRIIKTELLPMVNKGGECYIVGTPQTNDDFFFDAELQTRFATWFTPAIIDITKQVPLWPEFYSYGDLMQIKAAMGDKSFNQEYMASPVYNEDSYLNRENLIAACIEVCWKKNDWTNALANAYVVGGFDIGKKVHPSHLALFIRTFYTDEEGKEHPRYRQIFSYWMDGWQYGKQYKFLNDIVALFNVSVLYYDNTRAEFEGFAEEGLLDPALVPVTLNTRNQTKMAANMDTLLDRGDVTFINERRQQSQLLAVDNTLDALESPDGHGDSFWSVGMAMSDNDDGSITLRT